MPSRKRKPVEKVGSSGTTGESSMGTSPTKTPSKPLAELSLKPPTPSTPPTPCRKPKDYSKDRVCVGVAWVDEMLAKPDELSPLSSKVLTSYKAACMDLLRKYQDRASHLPVADDEIHTARWAVFEQELALAKNDFLREATSAEERETIVLGHDLLKLRRFEYQARYGDYFQKLVTELRVTAKKENVPGAELLSGRRTWLLIQDDIEKELGGIDRLAAEIAKEPTIKTELDATPDSAPTVHAVIKACKFLRFDWREMLFAIRSYAERNEAMHSGLDDLIEKGNANSVASRLFNDLYDLPKVFASDLAADEAILARILNKLIGDWFESKYSKETDEYYNPDEWIATELYLKEAFRIHRTRRGASEPETSSASGVKETASSKLAIRLAKEIVKADVDSNLIEAITSLSSPESLPQPESIGAFVSGSRKRPASTASSKSEQERKDAVRQQIQAYDHLQMHWRNAHEMFFNLSEHFLMIMNQLRRDTATYHGRFGPSIERPTETDASATTSKSATAIAKKPSGLANPVIPERRSSKPSTLSALPSLPSTHGTMPSKEGTWEILFSPYRDEHIYVNHDASDAVVPSSQVIPKPESKGKDQRKGKGKQKG